MKGNPIQPVSGRWLEVEEIRLIADLRVMHAKVEELFFIVDSMRRRHSGDALALYFDEPVLMNDVRLIDDVYQWYLDLRERRLATAPEAGRQGPLLQDTKDDPPSDD
jgi:hypothetical protein